MATIGWSSKTGFQHAETPLQKRIVDAANAALRASDKSSGMSIANPTGGWETDTADGDGIRMRNAIKRFRNWSPQKATLSQIKTQMAAEFNGSAYGPSQTQSLVDRIIFACNNYPCSVPPYIPSDDNQTLSFLGIRKQCLEWAMTIAKGAGGIYLNYKAAPKNLGAKLIRPGMGLYRSDSKHSMLIIDIEWDSQGNPAHFKVAESNYIAGSSGLGWKNPPGAVPWERIIGMRDKVTLTGHYAVKYDV